MPDTAHPAITVATLSLTEADHFRFADFSGDRNPMHVDAVYARRTLPAAIAAYGMQMLLWALDALAAQDRIDPSLNRIRVRFVKWIYPGDTVRLLLSKHPSQHLPGRVELFVDEALATTIDLFYGDARVSSDGPLPVAPQHARRTQPAEHSIEQLATVSGTVPLCDVGAAAELFPALSRVLGPALVADIATVSYVVGMEAPGLYSIDSRADWTLRSTYHAGVEEHAFAYQVASVEERFRLARLHVRGAVIQGWVEALVRRPAVTQMAFFEVQPLVRNDEFAPMRALVVGGSRGVGEATAKLLAAGGADVTITYARGHREAVLLRDEAAQAGRNIAIAPYDVLDPDAVLPALSGKPWTHLFYFATGPMFLKRTAADAERAAAEMHAIYVEAFERCLNQVRLARQPTRSRLVVFFPSTDRVDASPSEHHQLVEAKLAGEAVCAAWNEQALDVLAVSERLPPMRTDQTAAVLPQRDTDAVAVMLPILRRLAFAN